MDVVYYCNVKELSAHAAYFKLFLCKYDNIVIPEEAVIFYPGITTHSNVIALLETIQNEPPLLPKLLTFLSAKAIFVLADYFGAISILEEIVSNYYNNFTLGPAFLKYFVEYYTAKHPLSKKYLFMLAEAFAVPRFFIFSYLFSENPPSTVSTKKLKKLIRDNIRKNALHSRLFVLHCRICKQSITYIQHRQTESFKIAPCCGSPVHTACVPYLIKRHNSTHCTICKTLLINGRPHTIQEPLSTALARNNIRTQYHIPEYVRLPALEEQQ